MFENQNLRAVSRACEATNVLENKSVTCLYRIYTKIFFHKLFQRGGRLRRPVVHLVCEYNLGIQQMLETSEIVFKKKSSKKVEIQKYPPV